MRYRTWISSITTLVVSIFCAHNACAELVFDGTKFAFKAAVKSGKGSFENVTQTYEPSGINEHQCSLFVYPRPKSTVADILNLDKKVMRPPVTIAPLEIINKPSQKYKDDAASVIVIRNNEDKSKFTVILHRATQMSDDLVRELQVECNLKYSGLFSNSISGFEKLKDTWVTDVFELEPEISATK